MEKQKAVQMLNCCRICSVETETGIPVFGDDGKNLYLQAKIKKYLYVTILPEDKLPKIVCDNCCKKIEDVHKFALMAFTNQTTFRKSIANSSITTESVLEPKRIENKGLLHTYLTKGIKEDQEKCEGEVTEVEVRIDPMAILQCSIEEAEDTPDTTTDKQQCFTSNLTVQNHMWSHTPQAKRLVIENGNFEENNHKNIEVEAESGDTKNKYDCPICGKYISTKGNLKVHLETHRPKGKYECDICGRIFKTQCNLHRHKEYHEGIQFTCQVCGRVYPTNSTLRAHSITHSNLRPHKCPQCDKTFKRNQDLKFHINQHTGARPYQCPYCPKAFASSGNCFSHRKRMHPIEVERDREQVAKFE